MGGGDFDRWWCFVAVSTPVGKCFMCYFGESFHFITIHSCHHSFFLLFFFIFTALDYIYLFFKCKKSFSRISKNLHIFLWASFISNISVAKLSFWNNCRGIFLNLCLLLLLILITNTFERQPLIHSRDVFSESKEQQSHWKYTDRDKVSISSFIHVWVKAVWRGSTQGLISILTFDVNQLDCKLCVFVRDACLSSRCSCYFHFIIHLYLFFYFVAVLYS